MANNSKDVIYIDIDDEITAVIDKVRASHGKIIALVLPKRASVFQSIVNMKLLKRAADEDKKRLVVITSEAGLLPLAGAVGLHVAKTLQSKPEIPALPEDMDAEETIDEDTSEPVDVSKAGDKPIGQLAGAAASVPIAGNDAMETVELDNDEDDADSAAKSSAPLALAAKLKKNKKLRIPDFNRFRLWLALGVLLFIGLIIFLILAATVLPKATIAIKTNSSNVNASATLTLDTNATSLDLAKKVAPAKKATEQKTYTQQAAATGQKNTGNKATGSVTMTAKECYPNLNQPGSVPAFTGVTSSGGQKFTTQETTKFSNSGVVSGSGQSTCVTYQATGSTDISAQSAGTSSNLDSANFTVSGRSDVTASGGTSGGTDNIVKVVSQSDIDGATGKINTDDPTVKTDLQNQLKGLQQYALTDTFSSGTPAVTSSAQAGDTADNVTVTEVVTYTMFGAKQADLKSLLDDNIKGQIDTSKQSILSEGLDKPQVKVISANDTSVQITLQTTGIVGPDLNINAIKQAAVGKKSGQIESDIKNDPGITDVTVKMSPFWVSTAPKASKITVTIAKPTTTVNAKH
jgi:hypothetical protein